MPRFVFLARYRQELPFGGVLAGLSLSLAGLSLSLSLWWPLSLSLWWASLSHFRRELFVETYTLTSPLILAPILSLYRSVSDVCVQSAPIDLCFGLSGVVFSCFVLSCQ